MDQDRVQREALYAEVWETPMLALAPKYGVSAVFLRRVCVRLGIPCPPRGYWARKQSGQNPKIPPLPKLKPGQRSDWKKGDVLTGPQITSTTDATPKDAREYRSLLLGSLSAFTSGKVAGDGYLKPAKRSLADLIVTEHTLRRAAAFLVKLANSLRKARYRVSVAHSDGSYSRQQLGDADGRLKRSVLEANLWYPGRPTLVFIGGTAIGLTIFEQTDSKEMVFVGGRYIPASEINKPKRGGWAQTSSHYVSTHYSASGKLCLKAYSPYHQAEWAHTWTEEKATLSMQITEIVGSLTRTARTLAPKIIEANRKADEEHKRWQAEQVVWRAKYERSLIIKAREDALQNLLEIIGKWSDDRKLQDFFEDITSRSAALSDEARTELLQKVQEAKSLLASTDSIGTLLAWEAPPPKPPE
ncbi:MAG: hypothetical protein ACRER8_22290 [Pseudomonas sp.]|uniref:hypothetical protein n=1 Tax=Pseudomonas sp. TaxID=306 RepID=UPI003D6E001A